MNPAERMRKGKKKLTHLNIWSVSLYSWVCASAMTGHVWAFVTHVLVWNISTCRGNHGLSHYNNKQGQPATNEAGYNRQHSSNSSQTAKAHTSYSLYWEMMVFNINKSLRLRKSIQQVLVCHVTYLNKRELRGSYLY